MPNLAIPVHPAFARWPALARAAAYGVAVELRPGVVVRVQPRVVGDLVQIPAIVETPYGPIRAIVETHVDTFGRLATEAERRNVVPRLSQFFEQHTGRPLLPRGF